MSKFCGNCGAELTDYAKVCGQCGTPLVSESRSRAVKVVAPEKQAKVKKMLKRIVGLVAIVIVAVIAINMVSAMTGYHGLLRKVMGAYEKYDVDKLVSLSSDMYYYGDENFVEDYFEYHVGEDLDYFESAVGHSHKLSYKVTETYALSDRKLDALFETIELSYPDFDIGIVKKVVIAEVLVTAKQGNKSVSRELQVTMTKESGSWKLLYIE